MCIIVRWNSNWKKCWWFYSFSVCKKKEKVSASRQKWPWGKTQHLLSIWQTLIWDCSMLICLDKQFKINCLLWSICFFTEFPRRFFTEQRNHSLISFKFWRPFPTCKKNNTKSIKMNHHSSLIRLVNSWATEQDKYETRLWKITLILLAKRRNALFSETMIYAYSRMPNWFQLCLMWSAANNSWIPKIDQ